MKRIIDILRICIVFSFFLVSCATGNNQEKITEPTELVKVEIPTTESIVKSEEPEDVLYLNLIWHQHQPLYYKNEDGVYTRPWVRVHATKDYYDMASILENYPEVHLTFNLTPVLIKQLDDFSKNGATDLYWEYAMIPAEQLSMEQKEFILTRFFDANSENMIGRFPRYKELLDKRGGGSKEEIEVAINNFTASDFRDLQIWFNLAWFDPDFLDVNPLKILVEKQQNFSESDKEILFSEAVRVMNEIITIHKKLQDNGQIEVITTPYAHPILPLIIDSTLAGVGNPTTDLPTKFSFPQDAVAHLEKSVEIYKEQYGKAPRGLWPGEGSVAQMMVPFVIKAGYEWMATGEPVLAKSLGINSFTRDAKETVKEADLLYRPYYVKNQSGDKLAVFFRDGNFSDKIGFTYSGLSGAGAAKDLITRLENVRQQLKNDGSVGPHIVTIVVDGENAWEYYENDGKEFFHSLYQALSESKTIKTITPSNYLEKFPEQREIEDLFPGAWFSPNYDTWIGEAEENQAWEYLRQTRDILAKYDISKVRKASETDIALAQDYMYLAEGSDWFWWYGADQDSGQDVYFDEGFRALLRNVFLSLGEPVPTFVDVPIIQARPISADSPVTGLSSPVIDGKEDGNEWGSAGSYLGEDGGSIKSVKFTQDEKNLYFLISSDIFSEVSKLGLFIKSPRGTFTGYPFTNSPDKEKILLGSTFTHLIEWTRDKVQFFSSKQEGWNLEETNIADAEYEESLEIAVPLSILGELETGDEVQFIVFDYSSNSRIPEIGPGQIIIPDLGLSTVVLEISDPENDDFGPGTYTYPTDSVFPGKAYDLKTFRVAYDDNNIIFKFELFGPIPNPWGSPNNLAIQTFDIYIDTDPGSGTGARKFLPGRNLSLSSENGWDYAIWVEGWTPQILSPDPVSLDPKELSTADFKIIVDPSGRSVTVRVAKTVFGSGDPNNWGYAAILMGQEGYPSSGVWRIRDVEVNAAQWRFGGAGNSTNHTRVIDMIWPDGEELTQVDMLSNFTSSNAPADQLGPDDYAIIELLIP